jgi:glycosyltransferase involved in cell wall biosynthesis
MATPPMKHNQALLSVIVPAFNEAGVIVSVLESMRNALQRLPCASEIIVVDDASADETVAVVSRLDGVRLLRNPVNLGYGHSLLRGIAVARGDVIAICDADGTYDPAGIPELYAELETGADHVIGRRMGKGPRRFRLLRGMYRWLCGYVVGMNVPDANSGLRVFRRQLAETLHADLCRGFSFTTSLTLASIMRGYVVTHKEVPYASRVGRSHVRVRDVFRTAQYLFQLIAVYNPLKYFLPIIAVSAVSSVAGFLAAALGAGIGGFMAGVTMAATTLLLAALAAHAYIVSRLSQWPGWAPEAPRRHPPEEDLPAPPDEP